MGDALQPRSNSLNLLRLVLAAMVVFSHSITLGGYGVEYVLHWTTLGTLAVFCFFGISGYLIARSAEGHAFGRFVWHRALRILPAFWVCLVVVAFGFAWLGWLHSDHACGFSCFVQGPSSPLRYVTHNAFLRTTQLTVAGTLRGVPFPYAWNGSTWTLFYEFICYLLVGVLGLVGALRARAAVVTVAAVAWALLVVVTAVPSLNIQFNAFHHWELTNILRFVPVFLTGTIIYLYRERIPDSGWIAVGSIVAMLLTYLIPIGNGVPSTTLTRSDLFAALLAYPTLWLGAHLPGRSIGTRNDYSYGLYIYAFPVAQLLALWGVYKWGYAPYTALTFLAVAPLAAASWWLVEKRCLRLKDVAGPWTRHQSTSTTTSTASLLDATGSESITLPDLPTGDHDTAPGQ